MTRISTYFLLLALSLVLFSSTYCQVSQEQYDALVDLYDQTGGIHWFNNENWLVGDPCTNYWSGIICNSNGTQVTGLDLSYNGMANNLPESLGDLIYLTSIDFYFNSLERIPMAIGNLVNLEKLSMGNNQLLTGIPATIGGLVSLQSLDLSSNPLGGSIPDEIGNLIALESLFLSNSLLSGTIPNSIGNLTSLTTLDMNLNSLTGTIPSGITEIPSLSSIYLNNNYLTGTIPEDIGDLQNIVYLFLEYNDLVGSVPEDICDVFPSSTSTGALAYLDLQYNNLSGDLPDCLQSSPLLYSVELEGNCFTTPLPSWCTTSNCENSNYCNLY